MDEKKKGETAPASEKPLVVEGKPDLSDYREPGVRVEYLTKALPKSKKE